MNETHRIEDARLVGHEWMLKLAFVTEYEFSIVAGHHRDDAIEAGEEVALFGDEQHADRFLLHSEADSVREIYEDDVEAEEIRWIDGPTAPSENTFWDDSRHFDEQSVDSNTGRDSE